MHFEALIIDDNYEICEAIQLLLEIHGLSSQAVQTPDQALRLLGKASFGVVIQDMNFSPNAVSGEEGQKLFRRIRASSPGIPIILLTAWASLEMAVSLVKEGADDYLSKPWDDAKLVKRIKELIRGVSSSKPLMPEFNDADLCGIVFESQLMAKVISLALSVAAADVSVLISGPNGSGKEKIADIIYANSLRKKESYIKVNVGALPDDLMVSELFGAEQGAFTGAIKKRRGRFEAADRGTLFLDEIGNLSLTGQMKLLRVLQSGEFESLGSNVSKKVDVRIISATNADLPRLIAENKFREDLYFRINVIEIAVPALKDRPEDIIPLAKHFIREFSEKAAIALPPLSNLAEKKLEQYPWPGNIRELRNRIQRALLVSKGSELSDRDFDLPKPVSKKRIQHPGLSVDPSLDLHAEKEWIENTLKQSDGVISKAAKRLGISRQALYRKMEKLHISLEKKIKDEGS